MARQDPSSQNEAAQLHAVLRQTLSHLTEGISVFDADYRLIAASPCALALSGLTTQQAQPGTPMRDLLVLQARAGEFGPCDPETEADRRMAQLRQSPSEAYEYQRSDSSIVAVRRTAIADGSFLTIHTDVTARKRVKQELRAFKFVVDSITDLVSVMDLQGRYRVVNEAWCRATGLTREQALGKTAMQVLPQVVSAAHDATFARCLATREQQVLDSMVELAQRGKLNLETSYYPYTDDANTLQGVVLVTRDLTEKRAQERRMHASERFIATIANNMPSMMGYWTRDLRCAFANRQYQTWFGRSPEQMMGITIQELLGEKLFASNEPYIRAVLRGEDQQFERQLVKANGEMGYTWAQYIADKVDGEVRGFFVLVSDITALKQSQSNLEAVNAALRISAIAFEGQEGIVVADAQRKVLKVNSAFTRITGFAAGDLVGQPALRLAVQRYSADHASAILASVQTTGSWEGELWCEHADGHEFPASLTATAVPDAKGNIANYVITYIDITERHQRDEQRRANEAAQRAALVREVHHRIKNNLQGITGLLQLFGQANPQTKEAVSQAISQVKSIATIHGLQGQSGTGIVLLCDLVRAIAQQVREVWQVDLSTTLAPDCVVFAIAEEETVPIALVLNELLLNAVKHSDTTRRVVGVEVLGSLAQASVQVRITNSGTLQPRSPRGLLQGAGTPLMASLMPSVGARLTITQQDDRVLTVLELSAPVMTVEQANHPTEDNHANNPYPAR